MKISFRKYELHFKRPAGTSRGVYKNRTVWYVFIDNDGKQGVGECAPLPGLSKESPEEVEQLLNSISSNPDQYILHANLYQHISSVRFAMETALLDLKNGGSQILFPSDFTSGKKGIPINGLIWMGDIEFMKLQINEKLALGFRCLKLKIGALNFKQEIELLQSIRKEYPADVLALRVDANGAFSKQDALQKLELLAALNIHSIEQPLAAGYWDEMAELCAFGTLPIALDEELIGVDEYQEKEKLLEKIQPQYLVLKPSLHGGFSGCDEWIKLATKHGIAWWITSYLESNIGLNAISQWTFQKNVKLFQGLGTGQLFTNNFAGPLEIRSDHLWYAPEKKFQLPQK